MEIIKSIYPGAGPGFEELPLTERVVICKDIRCCERNFGSGRVKNSYMVNPPLYLPQKLVIGITGDHACEALSRASGMH